MNCFLRAPTYTEDMRKLIHRSVCGHLRYYDKLVSGSEMRWESKGFIKSSIITPNVSYTYLHLWFVVPIHYKQPIALLSYNILVTHNLRISSTKNYTINSQSLWDPPLIKQLAFIDQNIVTKYLNVFVSASRFAPVQLSLFVFTIKVYEMSVTCAVLCFDGGVDIKAPE